MNKNTKSNIVKQIKKDPTVWALCIWILICSLGTIYILVTKNILPTLYSETVNIVVGSIMMYSLLATCLFTLYWECRPLIRKIFS